MTQRPSPPRKRQVKAAWKFEAERRWAIVGVHGLYSGHSHTREQAKQEHIRDLYTYPNFPSRKEIPRYWNACYERGDRAIRVLITPLKRQVKK